MYCFIVDCELGDVLYIGKTVWRDEKLRIVASINELGMDSDDPLVVYLIENAFSDSIAWFNSENDLHSYMHQIENCDCSDAEPPREPMPQPVISWEDYFSLCFLDFHKDKDLLKQVPFVSPTMKTEDLQRALESSPQHVKKFVKLLRISGSSEHRNIRLALRLLGYIGKMFLMEWSEVPCKFTIKLMKWDARMDTYIARMELQTAIDFSFQRLISVNGCDARLACDQHEDGVVQSYDELQFFFYRPTLHRT
jgi:hypothetical protein